MAQIAQITDLHLDDFLSKHYQVDTRKNFLNVLDDAQSKGIDQVVLTGDLGIPESLEWLFAQLSSRRLRFEVILGNHDTFSDFADLGSVASKKKPGGLYYTATVGGEECLFLDSSSGTVGEDQKSWLKRELGRRSGRVVVFVHHPVLDCGNTTMDRKYPLTNREEVQKIFEDSGLEVVVFCGHYHNRHEQTRGRITQYLTTSLVVQLEREAEEITMESKNIGYRVIEFSPKAVATEFIPVANA